MICGDRARINLSISNFQEFIRSGNLYVDKTKYIENILNEASSVLLITRPRRTGKSLNMNMLRTFLDCKEDTGHLFQGLYIANTAALEYLNKYPVIFFDFKNIRLSNYKSKFKNMLFDCAEYYLSKDEMSRGLKGYLYDESNFDTSAAVDLCRSLYQKYGIKPFILIDEYDKILMDNIRAKEYEEIRTWITEVFESCLKGNDFLKKAVLTGVTRISKESLLSGLNNLVVYDIFTPGAYDTDFSLTYDEVQELLQESELNEIRQWYNNIRVGNSRLYNIYSVLSYLHFGTLENYWGSSGTMDLLFEMMNKQRLDELANLVASNDNFILTRLEKKLSIQKLMKSDSGVYYYSFAVQAGYLTYDIENESGTETLYRINIPNLELQSVWRDYIMTDIVRDSGNKLQDIFINIHDTERFNKDLQRFVDYQLSYFDLDNEIEKTYHVFIFGMVLALGYKCNSNLESGYGRYDLLIEADSFNAIIEFKKANSENELVAKTDEALKQIEDNKYYARLVNGLPIYKIGISCYKKQCLVKTIIY